MIFFGHIGITLLFAYLIFNIFKEKIDYRFLIVGAILPDLIDKPIGQYIFVSTFDNGRIFGHTILFVLLLTMIALYVERKYRFLGISVLALGALMHQTEDQMWMSPSTSLWPTMGWQFPKLGLQDYSGYILEKLFSDPNAYVPEIIGLAIIAWFIFRFRLYRPDTIKAFLKTGRAAKAEKAIAA
ncbi:MAG: metal-dependent hydrolase [Methanocella sp.]